VHVKVWTALLNHMPLLALVKNINRLGSLGLLEPSSTTLQLVIDKLSNEQHLHDAKYVKLMIKTVLLLFILFNIDNSYCCELCDIIYLTLTRGCRLQFVP